MKLKVYITEELSGDLYSKGSLKKWEQRRITGWMIQGGWFFSSQVVLEGYEYRGNRRRINNVDLILEDQARIKRNTGRDTVIMWRWSPAGRREIALFEKEDSNE